jgi:hypothetical protein
MIIERRGEKNRGIKIHFDHQQRWPTDCFTTNTPSQRISKSQTTKQGKCMSQKN